MHPHPKTDDQGAKGSSSPERARQLALHHAFSLQHRKDIENEIFSAIENLLELPSSATVHAAQPSDTDVAQVLDLLPLFQPFNFDDLVEERTTLNKCGYVLCPNQNQRQNTPAKYRILRTQGQAMDPVRIVETRELEKWCSMDCSLKAQYLRGQLNEEPSWARSLGKSVNIEIWRDKHEPQQHSHSDQLTQHLDNLDLNDKSPASRARALAVERGSTSQIRAFPEPDAPRETNC